MAAVALEFNSEELLYDVKNYVYIEGCVMGEKGERGGQMVQDAAEDGNLDRIMRVMDLSVAKCREILYPYACQPMREATLSNRQRREDRYAIELEVPADFSQSTLELLERLIHEYIVSMAVADWLSITNEVKAQVWEMKAREAEREICGNLHTRIWRTRRRVHPF